MIRFFDSPGIRCIASSELNSDTGGQVTATGWVLIVAFVFPGAWMTFETVTAIQFASSLVPFNARMKRSDSGQALPIAFLRKTHIPEFKPPNTLLDLTFSLCSFSVSNFSASQDSQLNTENVYSSEKPRLTSVNDVHRPFSSSNS